MLLLLASFAHAACSGGKTTSASTLLSAISEAEAAFGDMDEAAFKVAHNDTETAFLCLDDKLTADQVVALHIHEALSSFLAGRESETIESLQAATRVYGGDALPSRVAPSGTALRDLYDDAWHDVPRETEAFTAPPHSTVYVDGKKSTIRPARTATFIQIENSDKQLVYTGYLRPDDPLPKEITDQGNVSEGQQTGVHFGIEAGLPVGARMEVALGNNYLECVAVRVGLNAAPTAFGDAAYGLMAAGAVDVPLGSRDWDFEGTFGAFVGNVGVSYLIGGAAQWDPPGSFQLNLGIDLIGATTITVPMADVNAQWVF